MNTGPRANGARISSKQSASEDLDACILRWLLHYSLQRIEDIALGVCSSEQTVRRHIQVLQDGGLVASIIFAYNSSTRQHWYHLTNAGVGPAATIDKLSTEEAIQQWKAGEKKILRLFPRLPALLHIQNMINHTVLHAPEALSFGHHPAAIRWRWQHEYQLSFHDSKQRQVTCSADAALVWRRSDPGGAQRSSFNDEFYFLWIYADVGIAGGWSRQMMAARLRHLLLYRESLERQPYRTQFPLVVVLTESETQQEQWHQAAYDATRSLRLGTLLSGVLLNLVRSDATARDLYAVWNPHSCQALGTRQPCSLQEMIRPITRAALPSGALPSLPPIQCFSLPVHAQTKKSQKARQPSFHDRLSQLMTDPQHQPKEREVVALLGLEMSQRYRDVLLLLYAHPLTSAHELATFLGLAERSVVRYLWSLAQWQCIESIKHQERSQAETRWKVTSRGLRYIAATQHLPLSQVLEMDEEQEEWQPNVFILQKQLSHTAGVYHFLSAIHQSAQKQPKDQIRWFESHMHCTRRYYHQGEWHNFRPDAAMLYEQRDNDQSHLWLLWLEWDSGTMSREQLRKKMQSYAYYLRSREWRRFGHDVGLPVLLFVTSSQGQSKVLRTLAEEMLAETEVQVFVTLRSLLEEQSFLAPIWHQAVPVSGQRHILKKPLN